MLVAVCVCNVCAVRLAAQELAEQAARTATLKWDVPGISKALKHNLTRESATFFTSGRAAKWRLKAFPAGVQVAPGSFGLFVDVPGALGLGAGWWRRASFALTVYHARDPSFEPYTYSATSTFDVSQRDFGWRQMLNEEQMLSGDFHDTAADTIRVAVQVSTSCELIV